jgi:glycolate oxidase FAD binding subunit
VNGLLRPAAEWELASMLADLGQRGHPVEVIGAGSKRDVGRPGNAAVGITTTAFKGITLYEPTELVMSARTGTPLHAIEEELGRRGQMLAFEPLDLGPALGLPVGQASIGGVFATNLSGPRRISVGAARDHLLGVRGVNGRAEVFKSGGRVMKNVTGVDVVRGVAGSWGTLAVMSEVTFKVMPIPEDTLTLVFFGLTDDIAVELLTTAMGTPYEISGAAHLQAPIARRLQYEALRLQDKSVTAIRIENFARSIDYRRGKLKDLLQAYGRSHELGRDNSIAFWSEITTLSVLPPSGGMLWRISTAPRKGPEVVRSIGRYMTVQALYDWSGGLVWLEVPPSADAGASDIRRVLASLGGHATLIRAEPSVRAAVEVFHPLNPGTERITRGIKDAFDPHRILNRGRMYAEL